MADDTDSEDVAALLSGNQRRFLTGESEDELSAGAQRAMRSRIRTRLRWSMYDFTLLLGHLPADQRRQVFNEQGDNKNEKRLRGTSPIRTTITDALGFFFLSTGDLDDWWTQQERWQNVDKYDAAAEQFAEFVESGIVRALTREDTSVESVDVSIDIERGESLSDLADGALDELPTHVLDQLLEADEITPTEYGEEMQARVRED